MAKYILREIPCSALVLQYSWDSVGCAASRFWKPGEEFAYLWIKAWYNFIRKHEEFHSLLLFSMSLESSLNYTQGAWVGICSWDVKLCPCAAMEVHVEFSVCWPFLSQGFQFVFNLTPSQVHLLLLVLLVSPCSCSGDGGNPAGTCWFIQHSLGHPKFN